MSRRRWYLPTIDWLLVFAPVAAALHFASTPRPTLVFAAASLSILPLAAWMGRATEHLADHAGEGVGGLLNATFGNAAELIIALSALRRGLYDVVKASLTGSIIGNILLVLGMSIFLGGLRRERQTFNATAARSQATMLVLAAIALVLPAAFHHLGGGADAGREADLSTEIAIVLLLAYGASLVFSLRTHRRHFAGEPREPDPQAPEGWSVRRSLGVLLLATAGVALISEMLVASIEPAAHALGMNDVFVGVVIVATVGNAAEHGTAVIAAVRNRMDLSLAIATGSSLQIALLAAPVLVLSSHFVGGRPLDLVFSGVEVVAVVAAVWIVTQISDDGESNWLEGVMLLATYTILALVFFFLPAGST